MMGGVEQDSENVYQLRMEWKIYLYLLHERYRGSRTIGCYLT